MITLSLCMIVKNEQETLERCLQPVQDIVDEIIIVDTGSADRTREIAGKYTTNVFAFDWADDFAAARNFSFARATKEYIIWLDADDELLPEDCRKLSHLKLSLAPLADAVSMLYHCDFDDHGNLTLSVRRTRIVKRSRNYRWEGVVHEDLDIKDGTIYDSGIIVTHRKNHRASDPDRNIKIYRKLLSRGRTLSLRDMLHYAMELHQRRAYENAAEYYLKFINNENITTEDRLLSFGRLADCYYHLGQREKERELIFKSFMYNIPRPEFCCRLAYSFLEKKQFSLAVFWYKLATGLSEPANPWATRSPASGTWLPHMQLGLCYYRMGEYELSLRHNEIALSFRPGDQSIINNIQLLKERLKRQESRASNTLPATSFFNI